MSWSLETFRAMFERGEISRRQFVKLTAAGLAGMSQVRVLAANKEGTGKGQLAMTEGFEWSKDVYERSVSSRCWWYTPYDDFKGEQVDKRLPKKTICDMIFQA